MAVLSWIMFLVIWGISVQLGQLALKDTDPAWVMCWGVVAFVAATAVRVAMYRG